MFITRKETYVCEGRQVIEEVPVQGTPPEDFVRFHAVVQMDMRRGQQVHTMVIHVPLSSQSVEESFQRMDAEVSAYKAQLEAEMREQVQQQQRPRVQIARDIPT